MGKSASVDSGDASVDSGDEVQSRDVKIISLSVHAMGVIACCISVAAIAWIIHAANGACEGAVCLISLWFHAGLFPRRVRGWFDPAKGPN